MREIKYRAWHTPFKGKKYGQKMKYGRAGALLSFAEMNPDDYILMQYTGLKDKNGVEIFEGDVVRGGQTFTTAPTTPSEVLAVVEYSERNTKFYLNDGSGRHDQFTSCLSLGGSIYQYEVIGNIYENPELLKESGASE